ncbi:MAG TPA: hypothetical protein K8U94_13230, partial [Acinetobacter johnsonii]|nr:hypothetical protein [Acinetobacter johnsonii]
MTNPVQEPAVPVTDPVPSVMGTPPAEPNPTDPPAEPVTQPAGAPESIDGYEVNVEGFNYDDFKAIPENQEFLERAREAGLSSEHLGFLLGEYNQLIPALMEGNAALDNEACITAMKETWGGDTDTNFGFAQAAANNAIQNGILTAEEVNSPEFGNNPLVLKMAAYFGSQLQEDSPPANTQPSGA